MERPDRLHFCLKNYHAIKEADLRFNGLTLLCGVNGCGKSSILRWLYYLLTGLREYREFAVNSYLQERLSLFDETIIREGWYTGSFIRLKKDNSKTDNTAESLQSILRSLRGRVKELDPEDSMEVLLEDCDKIWEQFAEPLTDLLVKYLQKIKGNLGDLRLKSVLAFTLGLSSEALADEKQLRDAIEKYFDLSRIRARALFGNDLEVIERLIGVKYGERDEIPAQILLEELGLPIFSFSKKASISVPATIKRVFYIDTPMLVGEKPVPDEEAVWRRNLASQLNTQDLPVIRSEFLEFSADIEGVTGGKIQKPRRSGITDDNVGLKFKLNGGATININRAATGIKSFAYIDRLLKTGSLDRNSMLLIDEPEAHLHPQWISRFAHLLVRLHKELGVCIAVSSHSPDMVQALEMLTIHEGTENNTNFYLADKGKGKNQQFTYTDQELSIEKIFTAFNKSLKYLEDTVGEFE